MHRFRSILLPLAFVVTALPSAHAQWAGNSRFRDFTTKPQPPRPPATPLLDDYYTHSFNAYDGSLEVRTQSGAILRVLPWATGVVRIEIVPASAKPPVAPDSSISVVQPRASNLVADSYSTPRTLEVVMRDGSRVSIQKTPVRLTFLTAHGDTLLAETRTGPSQRPAKPLPELGLRFRLQPSEQLYGTGARAVPTNRRGQWLPLYNAAHYSYQNGDNQLNTTLPVVLSSRGYGLFVDNYTAGYFDLGHDQADELRYGGEELTQLAYYVIAGPSYERMLSRYTALTGRQPLPPRWALGLIQSRFGYKTQKETLSIPRKMRAAGFPMDGIVLDLYWFGSIKDQGNLAWQRDSFPDPPSMMRQLKDDGVQTILISEPYVMRASKNDEYVRKNALVGTDSAGRPFTVASFWAGPASLLDMFKLSTDGWLWASYKQRLEEGAGGFWSDLGEPENHPTEIRHRLGYTRRIHNAYGMAWAQIYAKHYTAEYPNRRLFNLARSGWAGMQRLSVFPWSGDIHRSWSGFQAQVPIMLGMAMSGVGYMHSDAGGFCVGPQDNELYVRWLQHSALSPVFRPHGEGVPPEPYFYPEPYRSAVRAAALERYRLLPYLYSVAYLNTTTGAPIVRPLFWEAAAPQPASSENDAYFLGPNLLVAPVTQPGQRRRNLTLPAGRWYDYRSARLVSAHGAETIGLAAPLAATPLLARANAVVPTYRRALRSTADTQPADTVYLRVFADAAAPGQTFTLYDDDGQDARALANGAYRLLTCTTQSLGNGRVALTLRPGAGTRTDGLRNNVRPLPPLVLDVPTAPRWAVEGATAGKQNQPQGGTGPLTLPWPTKEVTLILTNLDAPTAPGTLATASAVAWLTAPDDYGRLGADRTSLALPYERAQPGATTVELFDTRGQIVRRFIADVQPAGRYRFEWNGRDGAGRSLPSGMYFVRLDGQVNRVVKLGD
jgi:oligosaccharide 4-alpha-D-glucosyltransferase